VTRRCDALVVGAGVIGSSVALELSRQGRDVVVVDKAGGVGHGSTSASSAIIRFNYSTFQGVALAWEALHCWRDWQGHLGDRDPDGLARFHRTGLVVLTADAGGHRASSALFDRAGVPWETWDAGEVRRRLPGVDVGSFGPPKPVASEEFFDPATGEVCGIFTPDAGYVDDPALAAHNLAVAAQRHGAEYLLRHRVTAIEMAAAPGSGGDGTAWRVTTEPGEVVESAVVVNAAGPWSARVNAMAGVGGDFGVTTRPLRQEVHHVPAPATYSRDARPGAILADLDLGTYIRPEAGDSLLVGGTEPECDPLEWVDDPDAADPRPTRDRYEAQVTRAARRLPGLRVPNRPRGVGGTYDVSDDWTPIYDRTDRPGFYVAIGTSGNQFKNAPVVGQVMATLVAAVEAGHDHDAAPVRFRAPRTGHEISLGPFSRLRRPADGAPTSVMG
jgi:glycine/D-amino acid oxidase-like deaminating enzyme